VGGVTPRPLLVLLPGTRFDAREWDGYAERIPEADLVPLDLPGHGTRAGQPYSSEAALAVVKEALAAPGARGRPVVLAGHSLGGYVAAAYAHRHPRALAGLVIIGATADPSRHPLLVHTYLGFARLLPIVGAERMAVLANATLRRLGLAAHDIPDATGYAVTPQAWAAVVEEARADQLTEVTCPAYLVAGQFDQLRIDIGRYARACRDGRVRIIPRASHLAPLTHRDEVAAVLREAAIAAGPLAP
jgi:pimeloyl-ACP methyl ester carboxylesterase